MARRSRRRAAGGDEVVGGGVEVVEHVLLVLAPTGLVPVLAVLVAAAQAGDGVQAARARTTRRSSATTPATTRWRSRRSR